MNRKQTAPMISFDPDSKLAKENTRYIKRKSISSDENESPDKGGVSPCDEAKAFVPSLTHVKIDINTYSNSDLSTQIF